MITDKEKLKMLRRRIPVEKTKYAYCEHCFNTDKRLRTLHEIRDEHSLYCLNCGSARLDMIQGVDSSIM